MSKFRKIFSVNTVCLITEINKQINIEEIEFKKHVKFDNRGVQNHILIGHGVKNDDVNQFAQ